jgi:hypothetical protein
MQTAGRGARTAAAYSGRSAYRNAGAGIEALRRTWRHMRR